LDNRPELPPSEGKITVSIDGEVMRWHVQLPDGISAAKVQTRIAG